MTGTVRWIKLVRAGANQVAIVDAIAGEAILALQTILGDQNFKTDRVDQLDQTAANNARVILPINAAERRAIRIRQKHR